MSDGSAAIPWIPSIHNYCICRETNTKDTIRNISNDIVAIVKLCTQQLISVSYIILHLYHRAPPRLLALIGKLSFVNEADWSQGANWQSKAGSSISIGLHRHLHEMLWERRMGFVRRYDTWLFFSPNRFEDLTTRQEKEEHMQQSTFGEWGEGVFG